MLRKCNLDLKTQMTERMLYAFERLRRLSQYKRKGTGDLHGLTKFSLYRDLKIVDDIKIRRLGLADHVTRMEEDSIPKKVLNGKFHNANH